MARLVSRLRVIADGADEAVSVALHDTADFLLVLIRLYSPVLTGWLRDSHQKESVSQLHILIGTMVNYSIWVHWGTSKQASNPYMLRAFVEAESFFQQRFLERLQNLG